MVAPNEAQLNITKVNWTGDLAINPQGFGHNIGALKTFTREEVKREGINERGGGMLLGELEISSFRKPFFFVIWWHRISFL